MFESLEETFECEQRAAARSHLTMLHKKFTEIKKNRKIDQITDGEKVCLRLWRLTKLLTLAEAVRTKVKPTLTWLWEQSGCL